MFCSNCGEEVRERSKFCTNCGAPVKIPDATNPTVPAQDALPVSAKDFVPGTELFTFKGASKTRGESAFASGDEIGTLHVYDNGLQFKPNRGVSIGNGLAVGGLLGLVATATVGLCDNIYPLEQIKELHVGKRMGVYNTLVISMNNGDVWSFCPALPGSSVPQQILNLLAPYMQNRR